MPKLIFDLDFIISSHLNTLRRCVGIGLEKRCANNNLSAARLSVTLQINYLGKQKAIRLNNETVDSDQQTYKVMQ